MDGRRLPVTYNEKVATAQSIMAGGVRDEPDISALVSLGERRWNALVWYYHDDDLSGPERTVALTLDGLPPEAKTTTLRCYRVDADHGNSYAAWQRMGSPQPPTPEQYARLEKAGGLAEPDTLAGEQVNGQTVVRFTLPRQGVALVTASW